MTSEGSSLFSVSDPVRLPVVVRRFVERSRTAIVALLAVGASDLVLLLAGLWYASYLKGLPPPVSIEETELQASGMVYGLAAIANLGVNLIAAVCFLLWFYRAYKNLDQTTSVPRMHGASWTVWGFLVPILNLYRPYVIMEEIRDGTEYRWDEQPAVFARFARPEVRIKLWWGLYLLKVFAESFTMRMSWRASTVGENLTAVQAEFVCIFLELIAVVPAVMVVHSITMLQVPLLSMAHAPAVHFRKLMGHSVSAEAAASPPPPSAGLIAG